MSSVRHRAGKVLLTLVKKLADGVSVVELAVHLSIVGLNFRLLVSL